MVLVANPFIHRRVGELDVITQGWHYMRRTMNDEDREGFEKMINTPGFCVKKFEETYLLKRINPMGKNAGNQSLSCDQQDCSCKTSLGEQQFTQMKNQFNEFLEKWESTLKHLSVQPKIQDQVSRPINPEKQAEVQVQNSEPEEEQKAEVEVQQHDELPTMNQAEITEVHENTEAQEEVAIDGAEQPEEVLLETCEKQEIKTDSVLEEVVSNTQPEEQQLENENTVEITCIEEEEPNNSLSPASEISPISVDSTSSVGTPDSGMISDISGAATEKMEKQLLKKFNPEKLPGRDGRRARQRLKAEKEAEELQKAEELKKAEELEKADENKDEETVAHEKTGKEKRRMKDKLRKEKREQDRLMAESQANEVKSSVEKSSVDATSEVETSSSGSVEHRDEPLAVSDKSEVSKTEDSVESQSMKKPATMEVISLTNETVPTPPSTSELAKSSTKVVSKKGLSKNQNVALDTQLEKSSCPVKLSVENPVEKPSLIDEPEQPTATDKEDKKKGETSDAQALESIVPTNASAQSTSEVAGASKKLSKSQKKKAQQKTNKGVYVVNDNKIPSHTVDLLPGEYKIMKIDQQKLLEEVDLDFSNSKEVNIDEKISEHNNSSQSKQKKKRNFYVAGNLSQNILDNGKWLAYVIDDQNPEGIPKVGEVSNEEVAETMKLFDSRIALSQKRDDDMPCTSASAFKKPATPNTPESDAEYVRKILRQEAEGGEDGCHVEIDEEDDLDWFLKKFGDKEQCHAFQTEFGRKTSSLFAENVEFKDFCTKYSSSKYDSRVVHNLIKKYINNRIVYHYERFKKLADRESHRICKRWTHIHECSAYALMVMLFINNPTSNVGFDDFEAAMFAETSTSSQ